MNDTSGDPLRLLFPFILTVFVALYVVGLLVGTAPEIALLRAGAAGVLLAALGRLARGLLDAAPAASNVVTEPRPAAQHLDTAIGDEAETPWQAAREMAAAAADPGRKE
ncbi:MAG TPA: hypothetical protein VNM50_08510 [Chloroflexota bacterium]|nr:hypothetical protein [Chloroflexota bacterium]